MPSRVQRGQVSEFLLRCAPGKRTLLGLLAIVLACTGAWQKVRTLDALETVETLEAPRPERWSHRADGQHELLVARAQAVPAQGSLRLRACAEASPPELWMELRPPGELRSPPLLRVRLDAERMASPRCTEARWESSSALRVDAILVVKSDPLPLRSVTCRTGGTIRGLDFLPLAILSLGTALVVLAPRRREDAPMAPTLPWPSRGFDGVLLAALAFLGVHALARIPSVVGGLHGVTMLCSVIVQQVALTLAAATMMGAWTSPEPRVALELSAPPKGWFRQALVAATTLVIFAMLTALALKDVGNAPLARVVDAMPTRYVLAFGALCAPLPEELFFRGLLGRMAEARFGTRTPLAPVLLPALFFTAMHGVQLQGAWLALLPIAAVGLVNGWLRWTTRSLVAPWAVHTLYNGILALAALV
jgi:membrane protease YdiL (CAAX protease family)